jgi:hypothetical protein
LVETSHYAEEERLGTFSWERWGPGSIIALATSLVAGFILITEAFETHLGIAFFTGSLAFLYAGIVFVVKIFEEIHPIKHVNQDIAGMQGKVIAEFGGLSAEL